MHKWRDAYFTLSTNLTQMKAISFAAVSSSPQANKVSLADQHRDNERVAESIGATISHTLTVPGESRGEGAGLYTIDDAISQPAGKGAAYRELIQIADSQAADLIIFRGMDRLARTFDLAVALTGYLMRSGIAIYDREMPPPTLDAESQRQDVMSMISRAFGAAKGQREVTEIKRRNREGMLGRVERGDFANKPIDGYEYDATGSAVATERLDFIQLGFSMYLSGSSTIEVESQFNEIGFTRATGGKWPENGSIWRNYLKRRYVYAGYVEYNVRVKASERGMREHVRVKGKHPAILSDDQVKEIERIMQVNANAPAAKRLFSGVVVCRNCEKNMHSMLNGQGYVSYRCPPKEGGCSRSKSERLLKAAFLNAIQQIRDNDMMVDKIVKAAGYDESAIDEYALLQGQLESLSTRRDEMADAYGDGVLSRQQYTRQVSRLDEQEASLVEAMAKIKLPTRTPDEVRTLISELVDASQELMTGDERKGNTALRGSVTLLVDFDSGDIEVMFG